MRACFMLERERGIEGENACKGAYTLFTGRIYILSCNSNSSAGYFYSSVIILKSVACTINI